MRRLIIFALFALASIMAPIANAQWQEAYNNSGAFNGFHFTDSLNGWFSHIGSQKIIHTSDGGNTFDVQLNVALPFNMYDVYMEDNLNGWACGTNTGSGPGYIYRTTNGGADWIQQTHPASQSHWIQIEQVGSSIWFIGSQSVTPNNLLIMKTSDNGSTWDLTSYSQFDASWLFIFDSLNFIVYADEGLLALTTDGGNSWISTTLPSDYQVQRVSFKDNNLGYALVANIWSNPDDTYLYRSTDGGFTWNPHYSWVDQGAKEGLSIIPGTGTIFVTGKLSGTVALNGILKSTDGGTTWSTLMEVTSVVLTSIHTPDQRHGWVGGGGKIYRYDYVTPVTIEPISNKLIQFGEAFTYQVNAIGMGLEYSMTGNPQGLNIGNYSGLINGTPTEGGRFDITVAVQDTDANVVNEEFSLKVNRKPHFMPPPPPTHAWVDSSYQVQLNVEDLDDDTVSFSWLTKPSWLTFLTEGITNVVLQGVPGINDTGYHPIAVLADDGFGGLDTLSWVIQVELYVPPVNNLPYFSGTWPDTLVVYRDSTYNWDFLFQDIDGDTLVTQAGEVGVPGLLLLPAMGIGQVTAQVTGQLTDTGWYTATVLVKDEHGAQGQLQFTVYVDFVTSVEPIPGIPTEYALLQNYPNPFNPVTIIRYELPHNTEVNLTIYNLLGQEVEILVNEYQPIGTYEASFNASALPSGTYFYRLQADKFVQTKKMILLK